VRIDAAAERVASLVDLLDQLATAGGDTADEIGVSGKVFGAGMQNQIDSPFGGTAIDGRGEGGVDR